MVRFYKKNKKRAVLRRAFDTTKLELTAEGQPLTAIDTCLSNAFWIVSLGT